MHAAPGWLQREQICCGGLDLEGMEGGSIVGIVAGVGWLYVMFLSGSAGDSNCFSEMMISGFGKWMDFVYKSGHVSHCWHNSE